MAAKKRVARGPDAWVSKLAGEARVPVGQLTAHPLNFRQHPQAQKEALRATIKRLGFLDRVKVSQSTMRVIDGHLRLELAIEDNEPDIDIQYLTLTEAEEEEALLTFDPIGNMAETNKAILDQLMHSANVMFTEPSVLTMLDKLATDVGLVPTAAESQPQSKPEPEAESETITEQWMIMVTCTGEEQQAELLERFAEEGLACRALVA